MKVKLQPPTATDLPAYNPILPPAAITQVLLIANPRKVTQPLLQVAQCDMVHRVKDCCHIYLA